MKAEHGDSPLRSKRLSEGKTGQPAQGLARGLRVNQAFSAAHQKAPENRGYDRSEKIGPARVHFNVVREVR
jgi:hypothetical protein